VLVVLVGTGYAVWTFGGLDPGAIPARLRIYGRTYRATAGADLTAAEVAVDCPPSPCPGILEPALGHWPLVMPWDHASIPGGMTRTVMYLRVAPDRYRLYSLVGGP
jgi:hypothetical protein